MYRVFDDLRKEDEYEGYTEEEILRVLEDLNLAEHNTMEDMPSRVLNDIFSKISNGRLKKLNPNYEQKILDYFESLQLKKGKMNLNMIEKGLRYVLRPDITDKSALLVIDVQNDFIAGTIALKNAPLGEDGEELVDIVNGLIEQHQFDATVYSFDWHLE